MNSYSKTRYLNTIDSSVLLSPFEEIHKPDLNTSPNQSFESGIKTHDFSSDLEDENATGKRFGALKLKRNGSISSSFQLGSKTESLQSAVKRAFSLRRSSSVSERYCRIHDQYVALASPLDDDLQFVSNSKKKKNRGGKILKACKRIFGL
ncbi:Hypothetical predicted protein [Olea europaea subsp. europaea]|uniref:Uncharacterized protein n=1 Tax=Olea europaea subsp. europaea TaxID=158383 RepID=A0A8S0P707_OLEEU|nr:Hypothetical predicted protein [Olea europaea subsp. europaea]